MTPGAVAGFVVLVFGCQQPAKDNEATAAPAGSAAEKAAGREVPVPPVVDEETLRPLDGEALRRAKKSLEEVVGSLSKPDYLAEAEKTAEQEMKGAEKGLPRAALKAYGRGRLAYRKGDYTQAVSQLEQAHELAPSSAEVLRLLGTVHFAQGNDVRGAEKLREAIQASGGEPRSFFLVGRYAFRQGKWAEAILSLGRARERMASGRKTAVVALLHYYLGRALYEREYYAAAIGELETYLEMPGRLSKTTRLLRELAVLHRRRGKVHEQVGDAYVRLGHFEEALPHYRKAAGGRLVDEAGRVGREVYVLLSLGRSKAAERALVDALRKVDDFEGLLEIVPYLASHSGDKQRLVERLERVYEQNDRPWPLAMAVAKLLGPKGRATFLEKHVKAKPEDLPAVERAMKAVAKVAPEDAVRLTVQLIEKRPELARKLADRLLGSPVDSKTIRRTTGEDSEKAAALYLWGRAEAEAGHPDRAMRAYAAAEKADPGFRAAKVASIRLQFARGDEQAALRMIEELEGEVGPDLKILRVKAWQKRGDYDKALSVVDELIEKHPEQVRYRVRKAAIQREAGEPQEAARTLWSALGVGSQNEALYDRLFGLYERHMRQRWAARGWQKLFKRARSEIPQSPVTQLRVAEQFIFFRNDLGRAQKVLQNLLEEHGEDPAVRATAQFFLGQVYAQSQQRRKAIEAFHSLLKLETDVLAEIPRDDPVSTARQFLVGLYGGTDEPFAALEKAIEAHEPIADHLYYVKGSLHLRKGEKGAAADALRKAIEANPDHVAAKNDLAYIWADAGKNLGRAEKLAEEAVAAEPERAAYLDTLGWVYYKQGRFEKAVERLEEAATKGEGQPVILDHLGDARWRLGRKEKAAQAWRKARSAIGDQPQTPQQEQLKQELPQKLQAVPEKPPPHLAPVAGTDDGE